MGKRVLFKRWHGRCVYCGVPLDIAMAATRFDAPTKDHFIPRRNGGTHGPFNTVLACRRCNDLKGSLDPRTIVAVWLQLDPHGLRAFIERELNDGAYSPRQLNLFETASGEETA